MENAEMNKQVLNRLTQEFYAFGKTMGYGEPIVKSKGTISEMYILGTPALQIEVDWHENNLFMYAVNVIDNRIPDENVIYTYPDGQWCRKYIEELYRVKRPPVTDKNRRYSPEYLYDCLEFYIKLIEHDPSVLKNILK